MHPICDGMLSTISISGGISSQRMIFLSYQAFLFWFSVKGFTHDCIPLMWYCIAVCMTIKSLAGIRGPASRACLFQGSPVGVQHMTFPVGGAKYQYNRVVAGREKVSDPCFWLTVGRGYFGLITLLLPVQQCGSDRCRLQSALGVPFYGIPSALFLACGRASIACLLHTPCFDQYYYHSLSDDWH